MATTIHTLSYKMVADTQNFTKGIIASKSEVSMLKKILGDTTPHQKAEDALRRLDRLFDSGKLSMQQYTTAARTVKEELRNTTKNAFNPMVGASRNLAVNLAGVAAGFVSISAARRGIDLLVNNIERLDKQGDLAEKFKMTTNEFIGMEYAFRRGAEMGIEPAANAMETLLNNIQLAIRDKGKAKDFFSELGFEADSVAALGFMKASDQIKQIANEIAKVPDAGSRGLIITKLFGTNDEQLQKLIEGGSKAFDDYITKAKEIGLLRGAGEDTAIGNASEVIKDASDRWEVVTNRLTVGFIPHLERLASLLEYFSPSVPDATQYTAKSLDIQNFAATGGEKYPGMEPNFRYSAKKYFLDQELLTDFANRAGSIQPGFTFNTLSAAQQDRLRNSAAWDGKQAQVQEELLAEIRKLNQTAVEQKEIIQNQDRQQKLD